MDNGGRKKSNVFLDLLWTTRDVVQRLGGPSRVEGGMVSYREPSGERSVFACQKSPHFRQMLSEKILTFLWGPWAIIGKPPWAFFFRQLITFDSFEEEAQLQDASSRLTGEILSSSKPHSNTVMHSLKWMEMLVKKIISQKSEISMISHIISSMWDLDVKVFFLSDYVLWTLISSVDPQKNVSWNCKLSPQWKCSHIPQPSIIRPRKSGRNFLLCHHRSFFATLTFITFPYTAKHQTLGPAPKNFFLEVFLKMLSNFSSWILGNVEYPFSFLFLVWDRPFLPPKNVFYSW